MLPKPGDKVAHSGATIAFALVTVIDQQAAEVAEGRIVKQMDIAVEANRHTVDQHQEGIIAEIIWFDISFGEGEGDGGREITLLGQNVEVERSQPIFGGDWLRN